MKIEPKTNIAVMAQMETQRLTRFRNSLYSQSRSRSSLFLELPELLTRRLVRLGETGVAVEVPDVLVSCFNYILESGMVEGVFRRSGSARRISELWQQGSMEECISKNPNVHDVCGIAKKYLSQNCNSENVSAEENEKMIDDIIGSDLEREAGFNGDDQSETYKTAIYSLKELEVLDAKFVSNFLSIYSRYVSQEKLHTVLYLTYNLGLMLTHREATKMNSENLAVIFQPYIASTEIISTERLSGLRNITQLLIENNLKLISEYSKISMSPQSVDSPVPHPNFLRTWDTNVPADQNISRQYLRRSDAGRVDSDRALRSSSVPESSSSLRESITDLESGSDSLLEGEKYKVKQSKRESLMSLFRSPYINEKSDAAVYGHIAPRNESISQDSLLRKTKKTFFKRCASLRVSAKKL